MILGQLPLRAKPSHVEAEPGGSRGTVVIVRTRVGFGVSLVGGGARGQVFERSICAPNGHFWRLWKNTHRTINFDQPSEAEPIAQARLSGLPWLPGTTAAGSDGPCGLKAPS